MLVKKECCFLKTYSTSLITAYKMQRVKNQQKMIGTTCLMQVPNDCDTEPSALQLQNAPAAGSLFPQVNII